MEELKNNKQFNVLKWIFIIISIIHVVYATITMRGMYMDGGFYMLKILNSIANFKIDLVFDPGHPRFFILWILQLPVYIANSIFFVSNKFALMMIYSFSHFALPILALWWNYNLTKRTGRTDILFWNLFTYCAIVTTFCIFSITESILGAMLQFILLNYLVSNIKLKKSDYFAISFLTIMMFATFEYVACLGLLLALASIYYIRKESDKKEKIAKGFIGIGSLAAAIFNAAYMFSIPGEGGEIVRFLKETFDFIPHMFNLNILITITAIILMILFAFKKEPFKVKSIVCISAIFLYIIIKLFSIKSISLSPMWEGHFRTILCWFIPLLFFYIFLTDIFNKKINSAKLTNLFCIILLCGIFQTAWQCINTYYWNENIQYMKSELQKHEGPLYIPAEHPEISNFHNAELRRYIWHSGYSFISILFSDTYEQKTLLMHYDEKIDEGNLTFRDALYVKPNTKNAISIPYAATIDIKNKYWDLTKCAEALDKYNKENNIQTLE